MTVAPFVGVWIEIYTEREGDRKRSVAPFVGVWIEILQEKGGESVTRSLPSWECGLKYQCEESDIIICHMSLPSWECGLKFIQYGIGPSSFLVAPFVGVWIEIKSQIISS